MTPKPLLSPILLLLLGGASFVIIVAGMQAAASLLNSFFLAGLIAIAATPLLHWLIRKRLPAWLALLITILVVVSAGFVLIAFLGISISQLLHILPTYEAKLKNFKDVVETALAARGIDSSQLLSLEIFSPGRIIGEVARFLSVVSKALSASLLLVFIVAFMLIEASSLSGKLQQGLTTNSFLLARFNAFNRDIRSYVFITTWTGAVTAVIDFFILLFLGIDLAALWSVLFFLLNFIPAVGFILSVIPPVLLALLEFGVHKAILVFLLCWLVDNIIDKGVKPRYMQQGLDLSPLIIILSVVFWSWVLGAMGAILAVPLTLMVKKIILESYDDARFLVVLLGSSNPGKVEETTVLPPSQSDQDS